MTPIDYTYYGRVFDPTSLGDIVNQSAARLADLEYDSLVVRGNSGLIVGAPLALAVNKPIGIVHKGDGHTGPRYKGARAPGRYVIVDDFIESGATIRAITGDTTLQSRKASPVAILLYNAYSDHEHFDDIPIIKTTPVST